MLGERERLVFDRLAVFAGSFDADAASAVASGEDFAAWDVRDAIDDLTGKSMLDVLEDGAEDATRFRLLETLRQYALERLDDVGQTDAIRRRHAEHYAAFAEAAGPGLRGPDEVAWAPRFEAELDNLRAAVAWSMDAGATADVELGLRIVSSFAGQEFSRPPAGVGEWAEAALEHAETANPRYRAAVLAMAAWRELLQGDPALGRVRATAAFRVGLPPDTPAALWARAALASAEITAGDDAAAAFEVLEDGERVLDPIATADDARLALETTTVVVNVYAGRAEAARVRADALVRRARVLANPSRLSQALRWFAETRRPDEIDDTIEALDECLALSRAVAILDHADVLQALGLLAKVRAGRGERTPVIVALREAIVRCHDTGQRYVLLSQILNYALSAVADLDAPGLAATLGGVLTGGPLTESAVIPRIRADRDAALERVRAEMTTDEYDAAFARGVAMSYEEVVAYTLAELDRLGEGG